MSTPVAHGTTVAGLSPRATSALAEAGIETLEDALERARQAPDKLLAISGFGASSLVKLVAWGAVADLAHKLVPAPDAPPADPVEQLARELLAIATDANGGRLREGDADAAWAVARRFQVLAKGEK